jgi:hypothetical protein
MGLEPGLHHTVISSPQVNQSSPHIHRPACVYKARARRIDGGHQSTFAAGLFSYEEARTGPRTQGSMSQPRLKFERADVRPHSEGQVHVEVTFAFGQRPIVTSAVDDKQWPGPLRAASIATLAAIKEAGGAVFDCEIEELDRVHALGKELIAVLVNIDFEGRQLQLFGSCQIVESELVSAVRATLNATNRFVDLATRG